ncbi:MAG TPA: hypothetical protein VGI39_37525 [Polyangiaceae bacterium]|jgi:anti-sigma factor RsiW
MNERFEVHVAARDLMLYVIDGLPEERKAAVEAHVLDCPVCADALAREACAEAAFEEVARRARAAEATPHLAPVIELRPAIVADHPLRVAGRLSSSSAARVAALGGRRSRWAGGVAGALAAAAALVLAFASSRSEASVAQRAPTFGDAAGDMSGVLVGEVRPERGDALDGG